MATVEACIQNCLACYRVCLETKHYCIKQGGKHTEPTHLQKLSDCIELCRLSAHFMMSLSPLHKEVCNVCADACLVCAESCEEMGDDDQMKKCAEMCRQCEASCREMAVQ